MTKSSGLWLDTDTAQKWIKDNPCLKTWLSNFSSSNTKSAYLHSLFKFCAWLKLSPEQLLEIRSLSNNGAVEKWRSKLGLGKSYAIISDKAGALFHDLIHLYLTEGEVPDMRPNMKGRINKLSESSAAQKKRIDYSIRSFFDYSNGPLPKLKKAKYEDSDRSKKAEFMNLDEAKQIIAATKEPYKTLFNAALFAALGQDELLQLAKQWPVIKPQLSKSEVIKVEFARRKNNPQPYYIFLPSVIFSNVKALKNPFITAKGQSIHGYDIRQTFKRSQKRAGVTKRITPHNFRDLWRTLASKSDMKSDVAEFLMGHQIDKLGYNQIYQEDSFVKNEWDKLRAFIAAEGISEAVSKELDEQKASISALSEQNKMLRESMIAMLIEKKDDLGDEAANVLNGLDYMKRERKPEDYVDEHYNMTRHELEDYLKDLNERYSDLTKRLTALGYSELGKPIKAQPPD
jgi:integrase